MPSDNEIGSTNGAVLVLSTTAKLHGCTQGKQRISQDKLGIPFKKTFPCNEVICFYVIQKYAIMLTDYPLSFIQYHKLYVYLIVNIINKGEP